MGVARSSECASRGTQRAGLSNQGARRGKELRLERVRRPPTRCYGGSRNDAEVRENGRRSSTGDQGVCSELRSDTSHAAGSRLPRTRMEPDCSRTVLADLEKGL